MTKLVYIYFAKSVEGGAAKPHNAVAAVAAQLFAQSVKSVGGLTVTDRTVGLTRRPHISGQD